MTEANQKILYDHFIATGQTDRANTISDVYPNFAEPEQKEKVKKSK